MHTAIQTARIFSVVVVGLLVVGCTVPWTEPAPVEPSAVPVTEGEGYEQAQDAVESFLDEARDGEGEEDSAAEVQNEPGDGAADEPEVWDLEAVAAEDAPTEPADSEQAPSVLDADPVETAATTEAVDETEQQVITADPVDDGIPTLDLDEAKPVQQKQQPMESGSGSNGTTTEPTADQEEVAVTLTVSGPAGQSSYPVSIAAGSSVEQVMMAARALGLSYSTSGFGGLGTYVDAVAGVQEDTSAGLYWVYSVNGAKATQGVSQQTVRDGDVIAWTYEASF